MQKRICLFLLIILGTDLWAQDSLFIRVNQLGYLPADTKIALAFSKRKTRDRILLINQESGKTIKEITPKSTPAAWGIFDHYYTLDFTDITEDGTYYLRAKKSNARSTEFRIGSNVYGHHQETLLEFMRQQRCGYNPTLDMVCHAKDGRSFYGQCQKAAISLFTLGRKNEGYQQGNSFGAPYRYNEETWVDDMQWGAAELYRLTGEQSYHVYRHTETWRIPERCAHQRVRDARVGCPWWPGRWPHLPFYPRSAIGTYPTASG